MPTFTLPVPSQVGHGPEEPRPEPPQVGQTFSPVPGVPSGASSPGAIGVGDGSFVAAWSLMVMMVS